MIMRLFRYFSAPASRRPAAPASRRAAALAIALALPVAPPAMASETSRLLARESFAALRAENAEAYKKAKNLCEQAMVADPADAYVRACLGRVYQKEGRTERAYHHYMNALAIDPNQQEALSWSGAIDAERGALEKAQAKEKRLERVCEKKCPLLRSLKDAIERHADKGEDSVYRSSSAQQAQ